ncbi:MAG: GFA family protein [Rhodospirillales bacterium]
MTGSEFATNISFKQEEVNVTSGELKLFKHNSDSNCLMTNLFCPTAVPKFLLKLKSARSYIGLGREH